MHYLKKIIKKMTEHFGFEIKRQGFHDSAFVQLKTSKKKIGDVLLSYIIDPFLLGPGEKISNSHHNQWLSLHMATTFLDYGFDVDVISFENKKFIPEKRYSYYIGTRTNFQRISEMLNPGCVKILHLTTAHWIRNNYNSLQRTLDIQKRRGVSLALHKQVELNWAIEHADLCTTNKGNGFNVGTYAYAKKQIYEIPLPTCAAYPWPEDKDFQSCRNNFMWFGSGGLVHKGLDLVLEAFAQMPEYRLVVCGPIKKEKDFEKAFAKELYESPNITTVGWVDVDSPQFVELAKGCAGVVFASCAEGGGASVVNCMQAGLIPIVSYESCIEVGDFGVTLHQSSIEEIKNAVREIASLPAEDLDRMARKAWDYARLNHTRDVFAGNYRHVIERIMVQNGTLGEALGG